MNLLEHLQPLPTELLQAMAKGEVDVQAVAAQLTNWRGDRPEQDAGEAGQLRGEALAETDWRGG